MRKCYHCLLLAAFLLGFSGIYGQSIGIGTASPNSSAQLDISSASRGLLIPRMDSNSVKAIVNPAAGLMVYDSSRNQLLVNMGTAGAPDWETVVSKSGWSLSGNSGAGGNAFIGTTDNNPLVFKVDGVQVGQLDLSSNIGFGSSALQNNIGYNNIGIGVGSCSQASGTDNIAIGFGTLEGPQSGSSNIGMGTFTLESNTSGANNVAIGFDAMNRNQTGQGNTAIGNTALTSTSNSYFNTVVGANSAVNYDNGYNNVFVGANNDVNGAGYYNVIAIGQGVVCTAPSQARFGNSATNSIGGYADWTNFSDGRYKRNMREEVKGLDFIMRLRPITYNLDVTGIRAHLGQKAPADEGTRRSITEREGEVLSGFAAQEVEAAAAASGYTFSGVDRPKNDKDFYGLRYGDFVVPLVKAVQEQQKMIEALQQEVAELKKQLQK